VDERVAKEMSEKQCKHSNWKESGR